MKKARYIIAAAGFSHTAVPICIRGSSYGGDILAARLQGSWEKTKHPLGWSRQKFATLANPIIGVLAVGGIGGAFNFALAFLGGIIGFVVVTIVLFIWELFDTQSEMYRKLADELVRTSKRLPANFRKWRYVRRMNLRTAAQLWTGEPPGIGIMER